MMWTEIRYPGQWIGIGRRLHNAAHIREIAPATEDPVHKSIITYHDGSEIIVHASFDKIAEVMGITVPERVKK